MRQGTSEPIEPGDDERVARAPGLQAHREAVAIGAHAGEDILVTSTTSQCRSRTRTSWLCSGTGAGSDSISCGVASTAIIAEG